MLAISNTDLRSNKESDSLQADPCKVLWSSRRSLYKIKFEIANHVKLTTQISHTFF